MNMQQLEKCIPNINPQQFIQNAMKDNRIASSPMGQNAIGMIQNGDMQGIENMGRNICKENGLDPDEVLKMVKRKFGA